MSPRRPKHTLLLSLVFILGIPAGGVAYGFWTAGGAGAATGATGSTVALDLTPGTPTATLYPGASTNVETTVNNPNTSTIHITTLSLNTLQGTGGFAVDAAHSACNLNSLSYTTQTNSGTGWNVPPTGTLPITLPNALTMNNTAANACQGATITIYLTAS